MWSKPKRSIQGIDLNKFSKNIKLLILVIKLLLLILVIKLLILVIITMKENERKTNTVK